MARKYRIETKILEDGTAEYRAQTKWHQLSFQWSDISWNGSYASEDISVANNWKDAESRITSYKNKKRKEKLRTKSKNVKFTKF